jgi:nitrate reductase gamma subunit
MRRAIYQKIRVVTTPMDVILLALLLFQVGSGIGISLTYRWGTAWYVQIVSPYFLSLVKLDPNTQLMASMPLLVKLHALNAFLLVAIIPFTRLVHLLTLPIGYIWRPYQRVEWYDKKKGAR